MRGREKEQLGTQVPIHSGARVRGGSDTERDRGSN